MRGLLVPADGSASTALRYSEQRRILYIDCGSSQPGDPSRMAWLGELEGESLDLMTAPTVERGIHLARSRQPHLIVLELAPPWGSAIEVIASLRESRETYLIPIIALSSVPCANLPGLSMYCRRPIQAPEFLAMLRLLLRRAPDVRRRASSSGRRRGSALARRQLTSPAVPPQS